MMKRLRCFVCDGLLICAFFTSACPVPTALSLVEFALDYRSHPYVTCRKYKLDKFRTSRNGAHELMIPLNEDTPTKSLSKKHRMRTLDSSCSTLGPTQHVLHGRISKQVLGEFGHRVTTEHSNDKWVAFAWPQRIAQQCEDTAGLLRQSRGLFHEEVGRSNNTLWHALLDVELTLEPAHVYVCGCTSTRCEQSRGFSASSHRVLTLPLIGYVSLARAVLKQLSRASALDATDGMSRIRHTLLGAPFSFVQMESEQERFVHTIDLLELEVNGLEQHEDLAMVDRVAKLVGEISGRITDAENKCESNTGLVSIPVEKRNFHYRKSTLRPGLKFARISA